MDSLPSKRNWQKGKLVEKGLIAENLHRLVFELPEWVEHQAGQHYDIRLTGPDGYMAERSYSIGNAPEDTGKVEFGIGVIPDGEFSPYLVNLPLGKEIEMRGPIGGHFIWSHTMSGPLVVIGGGSGMVPLMSMLRHAKNHSGETTTRPIHALVSSRTFPRIPYHAELLEMQSANPDFHLAITLTENTPADWKGEVTRFNKEILEKELTLLKGQMPMIYICGPTSFVEAMAKILLEIGFNLHEIRTERFG